MPNWSYTTVTVAGPDAEIERFKQECFFVEPTKDGDGIDFDRIIPMPKIEWPDISGEVDDALVVLGHPELQFTGGLETVDDLISRARHWRGGLDFVKELQIKDVDTFKAEYIKRHPDNIAQAKLTISVHAETGFLNSLHWARANWGTKGVALSTYRVDEQGRHQLYLDTAWSPPVPVFEKIVALFPALKLDVYSRCEQGNYFIKGTISASGTDLRDDAEAMKKYQDFLSTKDDTTITCVEQDYGPDGLYIEKVG